MGSDFETKFQLGLLENRVPVFHQTVTFPRHQLRQWEMGILIDLSFVSNDFEQLLAAPSDPQAISIAFRTRSALFTLSLFDLVCRHTSIPGHPDFALGPRSCPRPH